MERKGFENFFNDEFSKLSKKYVYFNEVANETERWSRIFNNNHNSTTVDNLRQAFDFFYLEKKGIPEISEIIGTLRSIKKNEAEKEKSEKNSKEYKTLDNKSLLKHFIKNLSLENQKKLHEKTDEIMKLSGQPVDHESESVKKIMVHLARISVDLIACRVLFRKELEFVGYKYYGDVGCVGKWITVDEYIKELKKISEKVV